jgi:Leucine-rich repeat (LRR) protein
MLYQKVRKFWSFLIFCILLLNLVCVSLQQSTNACIITRNENDINNNILKCHNITSLSIKNELLRLKDVKYNEIELKFIVLQSAEHLNVINENQTESIKLTDSDASDEMLIQLFHKKNFARLRKLDLSGNRIQRLDREIFRKNHQLISLNLERNQIQDLPRNVFDDLSQLDELDLSNNQIQDFTKNQEIFEKLVNLRKLDLSNNSITNILRQMFNGLEKLVEINLAHNQLFVLPYHVFERLQSIEMIDLSFNRIMSVENSFFLHNTRVKTLNLSYNKIRKIEDNSFYGLREMEDLNLSYNELWNIKPNAFDTLDNLKTLNLKNNRIDLLSDNIFLSLKMLKSLDLSENEMQLLPMGIFAHQHQLEIVKLDNTKIVRLSNWISKNHSNATINPEILKSLRYVSLKNCTYIRTIESCFLQNLPNVETIAITHSQVTYIPPGIESMSNLVDVDLSNNRLEYIPTGIKHLSNLKSLNFLGNNLQCDCQMFWMVRWIDDLMALNKTLPHEMLRLSELKCVNGYPGDIVRILRHINCIKPILIFATKNQTYEVFNDAVLECSFAGTPASQIIWQTPHGEILRHDESHVDVNAKFQLEQLHQSVLKDAHALEKYRQIIDKEMKSENLTERMRQGHGITLLEKGYLRVHNISRLDAGLYSCYAGNIMGNASTDIR